MPRGGTDIYSAKEEPNKLDPDDPLSYIFQNENVSRAERLRNTYGTGPGGVGGAVTGYCIGATIGIKTAAHVPTHAHHAHKAAHHAGQKGAIIGGITGQFLGKSFATVLDPLQHIYFPAQTSRELSLI